MNLPYLYTLLHRTVADMHTRSTASFLEFLNNDIFVRFQKQQFFFFFFLLSVQVKVTAKILMLTV